MQEILSIILASLLGLVAGTITGLAPGIHNNLVNSLVISLFAFPATLPFGAFVVCLAMAHTILDFIPTVYLGVADDTLLGILPGHELLLEGRGGEAVNLLLRGALYALVLSPILIIVFFIFAKSVQNLISTAIPVILVGLITFMLAKEEKTLKALLLFLLAGFLGYCTLHLPVKEPLTPLLTGLFGLSGIILSLSNKVSLPEQKKSEEPITKEDSKKALIASSLSAPIFSFLPALGSGYAALFGSEISKQSRKSFLILNGFLNVQIMLLSFVLVSVTGKARTGAAATIIEIFQQDLLKNLTILISIAILSALICIWLSKKISNRMAKLFSMISYRKLSIFALVLVIGINFLITNPLGIVVLLTATALGIVVINSGIRRVNMMGCLLVPTIVIYVS